MNYPTPTFGMVWASCFPLTPLSSKLKIDLIQRPEVWLSIDALYSRNDQAIAQADSQRPARVLKFNCITTSLFSVEKPRC